MGFSASDAERRYAKVTPSLMIVDIMVIFFLNVYFNENISEYYYNVIVFAHWSCRVVVSRDSLK